MDSLSLLGGGEYEFQRGVLFSLPPELGGSDKLKKYAKFERIGVHKIDHGYLALVRVDPFGKLVCIPGLLPQDGNFKNKFKVNSILSVDGADKYLSSYFQNEESAVQKVMEDLSLIMHDLRSISTTIYHSAEEAKRNLADQNSIPQHLIENIISCHSLLRLRLNMFEMSDALLGGATIMRIPVFRKIDKVVRSFRVIAEKRGILLKLNGDSFSLSEFSDAFEMIPYIIIDNAIKYSPNNSTVAVNVFERQNKIFFQVKSLGPNIMETEREKIFERSYRGECARRQGSKGSGLGLFMCHSLLKSFNSDISVSVGDQDVETTRGVYRDITFTVSMPIAGSAANSDDSAMDSYGALARLRRGAAGLFSR